MLPDTRFRIEVLDGLRGMAILIVLLSHTSNENMPLLPFANFAGIGKCGVFLFFVLSAFLLTLSFLKSGITAKSIRFIMNYLARRFLRIYPLYFIYLSLGLLTSLTLWKIVGSDSPIGVPFVLSFRDFCEQLLLMQGRGVTWSILVEFQYYFILPVLALAYSVLLKNKLLPSMILTVMLIMLSSYLWPASESVSNDSRLGPYLPVFFIGSLLALIFFKWQEKGLDININKNLFLVVEMLGVLAILILIFMIPSVSAYILNTEIPFDHYHREFIIFGFLWALVLFASLAGVGLLRRFFEISWLRYLGNISFGMYLMHVVVLKLVQKAPFNIPMQGWIVLALTIAIAHVEYAFIEKPISRIRWVH